MSARGAWAAALAVTAGVAASLALAVWATARRTGAARLPAGPDVVHVEVTARQWAWDVRHPGADGVLGTGDDVTLANELRVPAGRPVVVRLRARDVAHGLHLPAYGVFADAAPAREATFWFRAGAAGESGMVCSLLCGAGHFQMRGRVVAVPDAEWRRWAGRGGR